MKKFSRFLAAFDAYPAQTNLRIQSYSQMSSPITGILSFILYCLFFAWFLVNCIDVANHNDISFEKHVKSIQGSQANGTVQMFAISLEGYNKNEFKFDELFEFQMLYFVQGKLFQRITLQHCKADQWSKLGSNYSSIFYANGINNMYCPFTNTQLMLNGTSRTKNSNNITILLHGCQPKTEKVCLIDQLGSFFVASMQFQMSIKLYILDHQINPSELESIQTFVNDDPKIFISVTCIGEIQIEFATYDQETDSSLLPFQSLSTINGIKVDKIRTYSWFKSLFSDANANQINLTKVSMMMNQNKESFKRKFGKLDQLFSYLGGLFSLLIFVVAFFISNFNQFRYEAKVSEGAFNYDESGNKIKEADFGLLYYIKYSIYDWVNTFLCLDLRWRKCEQFQEVREEINFQMDTNVLFRRLSNIESHRQSIFDKQTACCIALANNPKLSTVMERRYKQDYYEQVIRGEPAVTVEDLMKKKNEQKQADNSVSPINQIPNPSTQAPDLTLLCKAKISQLIEYENAAQNTAQAMKLAEIVRPEIKNRALALMLHKQFEETEKNMASSLKGMESNIKARVEQKIPLAIMYRLENAAKKQQNAVKQQTQTGSRSSWILRFVKRFFRQFDLFTASTNLRIYESPQVQSFPLGLFSFLLLCFFLYVFIARCITLFSYNLIISTEHDIVIPNDQAEGTFDMFAITSSSFTYHEIQNYFNMSVYVYKNNKIQRRLKMKRCRPDQWTGLGSTYKQQFIKNNLGQMFCPDTKGPFILKQHYQSQNHTYVKFSMQACKNTNFGEQCNINRVISVLKVTAMIQIYILDKSHSAQQKDTINPFINVHVRGIVSDATKSITFVQFSKCQISSDVSYLPFQKSQEQVSTQINKIYNYNQVGEYEYRILDVYFLMSQSKKVISRKLGKLDEVFSYVGGLYDPIYAFLAFFLLSFNQYRYELKVSKGAFNCKQEGKKLKTHNINLWTYLKYNTYFWIKTLSGIKLNWKQCIQMDQSRTEVCNLMSPEIILKRIDHLYSALDIIVDSKVQDCLNLAQPPSLNQTKECRLRLDYYNTIISEGSVKTMTDVLIYEGISKLMKQQPLDPLQTNTHLIDPNVIESATIKDSHQKLLQFQLNDQALIDRAEAIELDPEQDKVQRQIAEHYRNLDPKTKKQLEMRIPFVILYRLRKAGPVLPEQQKQQLEVQQQPTE